MSLSENGNQVILPGGATNSQDSPYISVWPLDQYISLVTALIVLFSKKMTFTIGGWGH